MPHRSLPLVDVMPRVGVRLIVPHAGEDGLPHGIRVGVRGSQLVHPHPHQTGGCRDCQATVLECKQSFLLTDMLSYLLTGMLSYLLTGMLSYLLTGMLSYLLTGMLSYLLTGML